MSKKYLNKDYKMYRMVGHSNTNYSSLFTFKMKLYDKFISYTDEEIDYMFGFSRSEICPKIMERDYDIMFVTTGNDADHIIISKEETEILEFFKNNAPLHCLEQCKRVIGLQTFGEHREGLKKAFNSAVGWMFTDKYSEHLQSLEKIKERNMIIDKLI